MVEDQRVLTVALQTGWQWMTGKHRTKVLVQADGMPIGRYEAVQQTYAQQLSSLVFACNEQGQVLKCRCDTIHAPGILSYLRMECSAEFRVDDQAIAGISTVKPTTIRLHDFICGIDLSARKKMVSSERLRLIDITDRQRFKFEFAGEFTQCDPSLLVALSYFLFRFKGSS